MQNVTDGRASKDWTEDDIRKLNEDLNLRFQKRGAVEEILDESITRE